MLVTKQSLDELVNRGDEVGMHAIGRALVRLFYRQTNDEKQANGTRYHNDRGFTPADARQGCISAKYYIKHGKLETWMVQQWTRRNPKGWSRISKYHGQLNEEAQARAQYRTRQALERETNTGRQPELAL